MIEEWRQVSYAPNYEVSNTAKIKNTKTNKLLTINYVRLKKTNTRARPYMSHNGKNKGYYLHRIGDIFKCLNKLPEVNHKDGDIYIIMRLT